MRSILRQRTVNLLVVAAAMTLALCGCVHDEPEQSSIPLSSASLPPFASDDEVLAAARATYDGYLSTSDLIMSEGGAHPERLDEFVTQEVATIEKEGFNALATQGQLLQGHSSIESIVLQSYSPRSATDVVAAYVCVDVRDVDVVDQDGNSVVADTRSDQSTFQATFDLDATTATRLRVASNFAWSGEGVC